MSLWLDQLVLHRVITWEAQKTSQKFSFISLKIQFLGKVLGGMCATTTLGDVVLPARPAYYEPWSVPPNCALSRPRADVCQYRMCDFGELIRLVSHNRQSSHLPLMSGSARVGGRRRSCLWRCCSALLRGPDVAIGAPLQRQQEVCSLCRMPRVPQECLLHWEFLCILAS